MKKQLLVVRPSYVADWQANGRAVACPKPVAMNLFGVKVDVGAFDKDAPQVVKDAVARAQRELSGGHGKGEYTRCTARYLPAKAGRKATENKPAVSAQADGVRTVDVRDHRGAAARKLAPWAKQFAQLVTAAAIIRGTKRVEKDWATGPIRIIWSQ